MQLHPNVYREILINEWFETRSRKYKNSRYGKLRDTYIYIKYPPFVKLFDKIYRKNMRFYNTKWDCYADCYGFIWDGMCNFKPENTTWEKIADKENVDGYKQLVAYLKKYVENEIVRKNNLYKDTTRTIYFDDGSKKVVNVLYRITASSINKTIAEEDGVEMEIGNLATESFWDSKGDYSNNDFVNWCNNNLHKVVTDRQLETLEKLQEYANFNELSDDCYIYFEGKRQEVRGTLSRIKERVEKVYFDNLEEISSCNIRMIDSELTVLNNFVKLLENEATDDELTMAVVNHVDEPCWNNLIYNHLSLEAQKDIIRVFNANVSISEHTYKLYIGKEKLSHKTLYEIVNAVHDKIEFLNNMREFESQVLKDRIESESARKSKTKKQDFNVPADTNCIYISINTDGIWQNETEF